VVSGTGQSILTPLDSVPVSLWGTRRVGLVSKVANRKGGRFEIVTLRNLTVVKDKKKTKLKSVA
jgi:hypothetical protein